MQHPLEIRISKLKCGEAQPVGACYAMHAMSAYTSLIVPRSGNAKIGYALCISHKQKLFVVNYFPPLFLGFVLISGD